MYKQFLIFAKCYIKNCVLPMKEVSFIRQNIDKWREEEKIVDQADALLPDQLADAYTDVTADLAFSQSHFPHSRITLYLNNLASALHNQIYRNKREKMSRIFTFWTREMPNIIYDARRELLISVIVFGIFTLIGIVSAIAEGDSFTRLILGNGYVNMTLDNIAKGHPMAVYGSDSEIQTFLLIVFNNVKVAFCTFAMGMLTSFGTGYLLMQNGLMVGSFQTFMFAHGVGFHSMLAIWLHGTLEISAIVIAGGAGIVLGNSWLFPGTYTRLESFKRGAMRGLKIVAGTVPIFLMAGFIEGFITRYEDLTAWVRLPVILLSMAFIVYYYIYLPIKKHHGHISKA